MVYERSFLVLNLGVNLGVLCVFLETTSKTKEPRSTSNIEIEQVRKGGLPPLALRFWPPGFELGKASGGKPPFLTCSISVSNCYLLVFCTSRDLCDDRLFTTT
jgi:hypothetical protein